MKNSLKILLFFILFALAPYACWAQGQFITTQVEQRAVDGHDDLMDIVVSFAIQPGWHVYGPDNNGGPTPMTVHFDKLEGAKAEGSPALGVCRTL